MIMKSMIMILFLLCMGTSLCVVACSEDQAIQLMAGVEFLLSSFAFAVTNKLVTNK
jgi:hypothetical protein